MNWGVHLCSDYFFYPHSDTKDVCLTSTIFVTLDPSVLRFEEFLGKTQWKLEQMKLSWFGISAWLYFFCGIDGIVKSSQMNSFRI